jgi:hypothetical protein
MKNVPKGTDFYYNRVMLWLRRGFVWFLSILLFVSLVGGVASMALNNSVGSPSKLEGWLSNSKIYDSVTTSLLHQAEKSGSTDGSSGSVSLNDPVVQQAATSVFTPSLVQNTANTIINNNYAWLTGKKSVPDFKVDLTSSKQAFAKQVSQAVQTRLGTLPVCSAQQLSQLSIPVDLLSVTCRPATLDIKAEASQVAQEINSNSDFIQNPVITPTSLKQDQSSQGSTDSSQGQPYYKKASWAPKVYQIGTKLPWILSGLALLSGLGIVFIAPTRRRGARRIGVVLLVSGLVLIILKLVADSMVNKFANISISGTLSSDLKQPISDFMRQLEPHLVQNYMMFGIIFVVAALAVFAVLFRTRDGQGSTKPKRQGRLSRKSNRQDVVADAPPTDASNIRLAPRRDPVASAPELPNLRPGQPRPPSKPLRPIGKNPPRTKPPRLIQ